MSDALAADVSTTRSIDVSGLVVRPNGTFVFDGLDYEFVHFTPGWAPTLQGLGSVKSGYPRLEGRTWETRTIIPAHGAESTLSLVERIEPLNREAFRLNYSVTHATDLPTREVSLQVTLPLDQTTGRPILLDGVPYILPPTLAGREILTDLGLKSRKLLLPSATGEIEITGVFRLLVQDQRVWKQDGGYSVRIQFELPQEQPQRGDLELTLRHIPWRSAPISLQTHVNRGFLDEVAEDGKGGWTDQGANNDLSAIEPGRLIAAGVTFDIIDPASNGGRSALVLGGKALTNMSEVTVPIPDGPVWRNLYLLHAGAWISKEGDAVGRVRIRYADKTESVHEVRVGYDVGNWWLPSTLPNGLVGWTGENASCPLVGLYVSRYPLEDKPIVDVKLESADNSLWMVAGVSGSPDDLVPFLPSAPLQIASGSEWAPYEHLIGIEPGGVFDFSFLSDAPAGKYGRLIATPAGHFEFSDRPDVRVRLWGVNLCFSANYLEPAEAEELATRLAASGYNSVRFHHYDRDLMAKGGASDEFDLGQLEKLDTLFAAMKRHGLYINIDLFTSREFTAEEMAKLGIDPSIEVSVQFKALMPISDRAFDNWKRFAKALLTHRNPHTGLTWGEDPALIGICPVNEDPLSVWLDRAPAVRKLYDQAFVPWWEEASNREKSNGDRKIGFNQFLHELQIASDARMGDFLRSLGVKTLLTGVNFHNEQALTFVRQRYDYVDNHQYWDHPEFPEKKWELPFRFSQSSAVRSAAQAPRGLMAARLWGKPYVVTEFNFVRPNRYRAEGGVFMPAYASLQDWDGLYNFDYASHRSSILTPSAIGTFSIANDPIGLLADRVSALVFRRGDIEPGKHAVGYAVRSPDAYGAQELDFPPAFSRLGLVTRIGAGTGTPVDEVKRHGLNAVVVGQNAPLSGGDDGNGTPDVFRATSDLARRLEGAGILPPDSTDPNGTRFVSDTGQIELDSKVGAMKVVTERSELFVLPAGQELNGSRVSIKNGRAFGTVSVVSLDGKPLAKSARLLVMHLTDALTTDMRFASLDRRLLEARGQLPYLVQKGGVEIRLRLDEAKQWRAWAVDATGKRKREVRLVSQNSVWLLTAETVLPEGVQFAYELSSDPTE